MHTYITLFVTCAYLRLDCCQTWITDHVPKHWIRWPGNTADSVHTGHQDILYCTNPVWGHYTQFLGFKKYSNWVFIQTKSHPRWHPHYKITFDFALLTEHLYMHIILNEPDTREHSLTLAYIHSTTYTSTLESPDLRSTILAHPTHLTQCLAVSTDSGQLCTWPRGVSYSFNASTDSG